MTLEEMKVSTKPMLTPADVAPVLGVNPYSINIQARDDPSRLGFPVARIGCRVKIPREAFIRWMEGR